MSAKFIINRQWNGAETPHPDRTYSISIQCSPYTGEIWIDVDAPFFDDPPPPLSMLPPPPSQENSRKKRKKKKTTTTTTKTSNHTHDDSNVSSVASSLYRIISTIWSSTPSTSTSSSNNNNNTQSCSRVVGLWEYEVVELFISSMDAKDYLEINLSPHGYYYLALFSQWGYHDNFEIEDSSKLDIKIDRDSMRWKAHLVLPSDMFPEPVTGFDDRQPLALQWRGNAFAIHGEKVKGTREYLSQVPMLGEKPNFHQPRLFQPFVLLETDERHISTCGGMRSRINSVTLMSAYATGKVNKGKDDGEAHVTERLLHDLSASPDEESIIHSHSSGSRSGGGGGGGAVSSNLGLVVDRLSLAPKSLKSQEKLEPLFRMHILENEKVLLFASVWKRKGWSYKRRILILTSKPRLIYVSKKDGSFKGSVPWTNTQAVTAYKMTQTKFDVELFDKSRRFHFNDEEGGADRWVHAVNEMTAAMKMYLSDNIGKEFEYQSSTHQMKHNRNF